MHDEDEEDLDEEDDVMEEEEDEDEEAEIDRCQSLGYSPTSEEGPETAQRYSWGPDNVQLGATDAKVMRQASKVIM